VDNIKMDLRKIGLDDIEWICLAHTDQWRALVNTVMNLQVQILCFWTLSIILFLCKNTVLSIFQSTAFRFHEVLGSSVVAAQLVVSQEWL
jgi:hypothetical protein